MNIQLRTLLIMLTFAVAVIIIANVIAFKISVSDLPDWYKYWLLQK